MNNKGADQTADVQVGLCICYSHGIVRFFHVEDQITNQRPSAYVSGNIETNNRGFVK